MPIVGEAPLADLEQPSQRPQTPSGVEPTAVSVSKTYKDVAVDDALTPIDSLVAYVEGSPWKLRAYYGQLVGQDSQLRELDVGTSPAHQQYVKYVDYELRVISPLTDSFSEENAVSSVTGAANMIVVIPNVNDLFIAEAGSHDIAMFRVTSVERKTFDRESIYEVKYVLVDYLKNIQTKVDNLEMKVVRTYHYVKERITEHLSPLLADADYAASINLAQEYRTMVRQYSSQFYQSSMKLLLLPIKDDVVYDAWVVNFLRAITETLDSKELADMSAVPVDNDRYLSQPNLWSMLLDRDYEGMVFVNKKVQLIPRTHFAQSSWLRSTRYWGASQFVYPLIQEDKTRIEKLSAPPPQYGNDFPQLGLMEEPDRQASNQYKLADKTIPIIKSINVDGYYVLSEAFYTGDDDVSVMEILVRDYLRNVPLDMKLLEAVVKKWKTWPVGEAFYYVPILLLLIKEAIRGFYK